MKLHQSIAVCLALMAGVTADGCFAQSATNQNESVVVGDAPQDPAIAVPAITPAPAMSLGRTREQVTHPRTRAGGFSEQQPSSADP